MAVKPRDSLARDPTSFIAEQLIKKQNDTKWCSWEFVEYATQDDDFMGVFGLELNVPYILLTTRLPLMRLFAIHFQESATFDHH